LKHLWQDQQLSHTGCANPCSGAQLCRDVRHQLDLQESDVILELQFALFKAFQLQFVPDRLQRQPADNLVEIAVLDLQLDDPVANGYLIHTFASYCTSYNSRFIILVAPGVSASAPIAQRFKLAACTAQHIGDRGEQQDRVGIFQSRRMPGSALFVVADGMGGKTGGAMAAQQVMTTAKSLFEEFSPVNESVDTLLRQIVLEAHTVIKLSALSSEKEPHSTIVALLLQPERADWAHVGDSRLYRYYESELLERTVDHSYVEQLIAEGKIRPDEAQSHRLSNLLTSALGTAKQPQISFGSADTISVGECYLLCSDGLWHYFTEAEIGSMLYAEAPRLASERLIQLTRERARGAGDNCTLAIVKLEPPDEPAAPRVSRTISSGS
jgi:serine/threonine protein phosphatase PrpC